MPFGIRDYVIDFTRKAKNGVSGVTGRYIPIGVKFHEQFSYFFSFLFFDRAAGRRRRHAAKFFGSDNVNPWSQVPFGGLVAPEPFWGK